MSKLNPAVPAAPRHPVSLIQHGITRIDPYAWMRDDNWQQVLSDPESLRADIREHLEQEGAWYQHSTAHLQPLRDRLLAEMRGRIREDDASVPMRDGPWLYYRRYREGGQYPIHARRAADQPTAPEQVLFDGDLESRGSDFFDLGGIEVSPDHQRLVYGVDRIGAEQYELRIRDIASGDDWDESLANTDGDVVWASDGRSFFYGERDDSHRTIAVRQHRLGTPQSADRAVIDHADDSLFLSLGQTSSRRYLVIMLADGHSSEARLLDLEAPDSEPWLVAPLMREQEYDVDHARDHLYIRVNDGDAVDFRIVRAPVATPGREHWQDFIAHRAGRYIDDFLCLSGHLVYLQRENALPALVVSDYAGNAHSIAFDHAAYSLGLIGWGEFETRTLRFSYASPNEPTRIYDYDLISRERVLRKRQQIPSGHNIAHYRVEALQVPARDGETIPLTLTLPAEAVLDGDRPVLLYGYGAYGEYLDNGFWSSILSLVDRGVIVAVAHVRGGSARGHQWYLDGKFEKKVNSFNDFNDCAQALIDLGYTRAGRIVSYGGSAGGLLVAASVNRAPELYAGVIASVPFVDVLTTISDASLPLTPPEWEQWGNPIDSREHYDWIAAYSPYDKLRDDCIYPPILATGGLSDHRVTYWEPAKWIARLRAECQGGPFLLRMNMGAGHFGSAGRFERLEENAHLYAFALDVLGCADVEPRSPVTIRTATAGDHGALVELFTDAVHQLTAPHYDASQREAWAPRTPDLAAWSQRLSQLTVLLAETDGDIAGFLGHDDHGHIDLLFSAPAHARRGIAGQLLRLAETRLQAAGVHHLHTEASHLARPLFERLGYQVIEAETVERNGVSLQRWRMAKTLEG